MGSVDTGKYININGVKQYIHILSKNISNPILVYLHGGPGDAALPLVKHFNLPLSEHYTLVIWEQRGSGKSYYPFSEKENITLETFIEDLKSLIEYLLLKFRKENVYLLGHSWGSIIGLNFTIRYPELIKAYIGCGQVTNGQRVLEECKEFVLKHTNSKSKKEKIISINTSFKQDNWYKELIYLMNRVVKYGGSLYGRSSYNSLYPYFLFSKDYSLTNCINRLKGSEQSLKYLWSEVCNTNFHEFTYFETPVIFIEGTKDCHCSSKIVDEFYSKIESQKKLFWIENSAHFPQWSNADKFNNILAIIKHEYGD